MIIKITIMIMSILILETINYYIPTISFVNVI